MNATLGFIPLCTKTVKSTILKNAAKSPLMALTVVIVISTLALPLISAAVLLPVATLFRFGEYLGSKGVLSIIYAICFQVTFLLAVLTILLIGTFLLGATGNIILHKLFFSQGPKEKQNVI